MIDRFKIRCHGMFLGPKTGGSARTWLNKACEALPFFAKLDSHRDGAHSTPVWTIRFCHGRERLCDVNVVETEERSLRLASVDANLPALLRGHNGSLPATEHEFMVALTRLAHLVAPLLEPASRERFLRRVSGMCSWYICGLEVAVQIEDPGRQLILDSHLSQFRHFAKKPFLVPGESTTFRSEKFDLKVYAKDLELKNQGHQVFAGPTTRIEAALKRSRALRMSLGVPENDKRRVQAISFNHVTKMLKQLVADRITGGLATPNDRAPGVPRGSTRRVLESQYSPANLHHALHMECGELNHASASKLRKRVFDHLASRCPSDLPALLDGIPEGFPMAPATIPEIESGFAREIHTRGWPAEPDPGIAAAFSKLRLTAG